MKHSVYYHIWAPKNDPLIRFLIDEQLKTLQVSSLYSAADIYVGVVGAAVSDVSAWLENTYPRVNIRVRDKKGTLCEIHTLQALWEDCKKIDQNVLYIHTKGLQHYYAGNPTCVNSWRHAMEYYMINLWLDHSADLYKYDTIGMKWCQTPFPHYQGNFWWSKSEFIRTLPEPNQIGRKSPVKGYTGITHRHSAEAWIGMKEGKNKCMSQFVTNPYKTDGMFMISPELRSKPYAHR